MEPVTTQNKQESMAFNNKYKKNSFSPETIERKKIAKQLREEEKKKKTALVLKKKELKS